MTPVPSFGGRVDDIDARGCGAPRAHSPLNVELKCGPWDLPVRGYGGAAPAGRSAKSVKERNRLGLRELRCREVERIECRCVVAGRPSGPGMRRLSGLTQVKRTACQIAQHKDRRLHSGSTA